MNTDKKMDFLDWVLLVILIISATAMFSGMIAGCNKSVERNRWIDQQMKGNQ